MWSGSRFPSISVVKLVKFERFHSFFLHVWIFSLTYDMVLNVHYGKWLNPHVVKCSYMKSSLFCSVLWSIPLFYWFSSHLCFFWPCCENAVCPNREVKSGPRELKQKHWPHQIKPNCFLNFKPSYVLTPVLNFSVWSCCCWRVHGEGIFFQIKGEDFVNEMTSNH